jgi:sigma-B regulation protein RsbU (phosphoserine phosphatase)
MLLLYTDGLTEAFSPDGDMFGEARLMDVFASIQNPSAEEVLTAVEERVTAFIESLPLADDLTMLAVKRR